MSNKTKAKSLIEKKLEDSHYRKQYEERYAAFKLEAQILYVLEEKGWTYSDLAKATHTSKSNVSRDLRAGGISSASFSRISRIAEALGMKLIALLVPKDYAQFILPRIEEMVRSSSNAPLVEFRREEPSSFTIDLTGGLSPNIKNKISESTIETPSFLQGYGQLSA